MKSKKYNSSFGDILPLIAANAFSIRIIICSATSQNIADFNVISPSIQSRCSQHYVVLHLLHEHYSAIVPAHPASAILPLTVCMSAPSSVHSTPVVQSASSSAHYTLSMQSTSLSAHCSPSAPSTSSVRCTSVVQSTSPSAHCMQSVQSTSPSAHCSPNVLSTLSSSSCTPVVQTTSSSACYAPRVQFHAIVNSLHVKHTVYIIVSMLDASRAVYAINYSLHAAEQSTSSTGWSTIDTHYKKDFLWNAVTSGNEPSFICLTQTKISSQISDNEISLPGYGVFRSNRNRHSGGIAIYYRDNLDAIKLEFMNRPNIEYCNATVRLAQKINVCCIYRPQTAKVPDWLPKFTALLELITAANNFPIIITGDFNIDLLSNNDFADNLKAEYRLSQLVR